MLREACKSSYFLAEDSRSYSNKVHRKLHEHFHLGGKTSWDQDGARQRIGLDKSTDPAGESGSN